MIHGGFRHLPVVDTGKVVGSLSIRDLMRSVLDDAAPRGVYRYGGASGADGLPRRRDYR